MPRPRTGGAVFRRGRWYARITLSREPADAKGERPRLEHAVLRDGQPVTTETRTDEAYARRYARRLQERYDEGSWSPEGRNADPPPSPVGETVRGWCTAWLKKQTYSNAEKDRRTSKASLELRGPSGWCFGDIPIGKVTPQDVAAWLAVVKATPTVKAKPPAPRTVRNALDPIARALRSAVFEGKLAQDPCAVLPAEHRPQAEDADPLARAAMRLSRRELETLLGDPGIEERWQVLWHLLALTGAREAEAMALRWCDLIPDDPLPRVRLMAQIHHRSRKRTATKTRAVKDVPMHPLLRDVLDGWARDGWLREYGRRPETTDLIVPARAEPGRPWGTSEGTGGALWQQDVHRALQRDLAGCCLPKHRVHDLRHTFVSLCSDFGLAPDVASRWTHAPVTHTARQLYLMPSWERQCQEMLRLAITPRRRVVATSGALAELMAGTGPR